MSIEGVNSIDIYTKNPLEAGIRPLLRNMKAHYGGNDVYATLFFVSSAESRDIKERHHFRQFLLLIKSMRELVHRNVNRFVGILRTPCCISFLFELCERGNLATFMSAPQFTLDLEIKNSLIMDLLQAIKAIHMNHAIRYHGNLNSSTCLLSHHFSLKVSDFAVISLLDKGFAFGSDTSTSNFQVPKAELPYIPPDDHGQFTRSATGDMYAVGILCIEILTESIGETSKLTQNAMPVTLETLPVNNGARIAIHECLSSDQSKRPSAEKLAQTFRAGKRVETVVESIIKRLSRYASDLEDSITIRTQELSMERHKCDEILLHMLPSHIVPKLRRNEIIVPEIFESVTLQFSDLVGFVDFVHRMTPLQVVEFLNTVHGMVDSAISEFDVYKVETIADTYFVASGIPIRNGERHATEMCKVTVVLRDIFEEKMVAVSRQSLDCTDPVIVCSVTQLTRLQEWNLMEKRGEFTSVGKQLASFMRTTAFS